VAKIDDLDLLGKRFQVSVFRFQDFSTRLPDTRNLTPDTYNLRQQLISVFAALHGPIFPSLVSEKA
jgi:hypothetical protein